MERAVIPASSPGSTWLNAGVAEWIAATTAQAAIRNREGKQLSRAVIISSPWWNGAV
jgi:hypothetical protein